MGIENKVGLHLAFALTSKPFRCSSPICLFVLCMCDMCVYVYIYNMYIYISHYILYVMICEHLCGYMKLYLHSDTCIYIYYVCVCGRARTASRPVLLFLDQVVTLSPFDVHDVMYLLTSWWTQSESLFDDIYVISFLRNHYSIWLICHSDMLPIWWCFTMFYPCVAS
jgi:hypothetical protein